MIYCGIGAVFFIIYRSVVDNSTCEWWPDIGPAKGRTRSYTYDIDDLTNVTIAKLNSEYTRKNGTLTWYGPPDITCRPAWFNEQFVSVTHVYQESARLGELVLTLFVGLAYKRYQEYYWNARKIQGGECGPGGGVGVKIGAGPRARQSQLQLS